MSEAALPADGSRGGSSRYRFPKALKVRKASEINILRERGKRRKARHFDVFFLASPASRSRAGIVVPKYGRSGVARNRLKRRIREILRIEVLPRLEHAHGNFDLLVRAQPSAYRAKFPSLRDQLVEVAEELCCEGS